MPKTPQRDDGRVAGMRLRWDAAEASSHDTGSRTQQLGCACAVLLGGAGKGTSSLRWVRARCLSRCMNHQACLPERQPDARSRHCTVPYLFPSSVKPVPFKFCCCQSGDFLPTVMPAVCSRCLAGRGGQRDACGRLAGSLALARLRWAGFVKTCAAS